MLLNRKSILVFLFILLFAQVSFAQARFSLGTDLALLRSFKKEQQFWAVGHNLGGHWHLAPTDGIYALLGYYAPGSFKNKLYAEAKSPATTPQQSPFLNKAQLRLKQVSIGWKRYVRGRYDTDKWNVYSIAGFGLVWGKVINDYAGSVDTSLYTMPDHPVKGTGHFKRLTLDLGLGWEIAVGDEIYFYTEGKIWIPTTEYPSRFLFINNNSPFVGSLGAGIRILF